MRQPTSGILHEALACTMRDLRSRKLSEVEVAVVDSGIDATHERCAGRICNGVHNNDPAGHGTAVAGIIAALAPNAKLLDVKVLDSHGVATGDALLAGFATAIESHAKIINMSLVCSRKYGRELLALCERAYRNGKIVVASKRNVPLTEDLGFPAEISSCIGVESNRSDSPLRVYFTGSTPIEFAACGESVLAPKSGGGYIRFSGTSFATPIITAAITLLLGAFPDLRPFEVKTLLKNLSTFDESETENPLLRGIATPYPGCGLPLGYKTFRCAKCRTVLQCASFFSETECPNCHTVINL